METFFTMDDNSVLWFIFAKNILTRIKDSTLIGIKYQTEIPENDIRYSTDPQLRSAESVSGEANKSSSKMYKLMNEHYYGLKVKLGLAEAKEEVDDILNDPVPISEQFPKDIIEEVERQNRLKSSRKSYGRSKGRLDERRRQITAYKPTRGLNLTHINKEHRMLKHNLNGLNSDIKFPKRPVEYNDPNLPLDEAKNPIKSRYALKNIYQPPLKAHEIPSNNPFCTKSFTVSSRQVAYFILLID